MFLELNLIILLVNYLLLQVELEAGLCKCTGIERYNQFNFHNFFSKEKGKS